MEGDIRTDTFNLFLHHQYGCKMDLLKINDCPTLAELHSLTRQFGQVEMGKVVKQRLEEVLNMESWKRSSEIVETSTLLVKHRMEELLPLVEEKVKKVQVGEEDLTELLHIVGHHTTPRAKVIILMKNCDYDC